MSGRASRSSSQGRQSASIRAFSPKKAGTSSSTGQGFMSKHKVALIFSALTFVFGITMFAICAHQLHYLAGQGQTFSTSHKFKWYVAMFGLAELMLGLCFFTGLYLIGALVIGKIRGQ